MSDVDNILFDNILLCSCRASLTGFRKVLMELSRRKWPTLEVGPLQTWRKRDIVEAFLKRSFTGRTIGEPSPLRAAEYNQDAAQTQSQGSSATFITGVDVMEDGASVAVNVGDDLGQRNSAPGLVLFPSMIESILST